MTNDQVFEASQACMQDAERACTVRKVVSAMPSTYELHVATIHAMPHLTTSTSRHMVFANTTVPRMTQDTHEQHSTYLQQPQEPVSSTL